MKATEYQRALLQRIKEAQVTIAAPANIGKAAWIVLGRSNPLDYTVTFQK